jgi:hypothetical protein
VVIVPPAGRPLDFAATTASTSRPEAAVAAEKDHDFVKSGTVRFDTLLPSIYGLLIWIALRGVRQGGSKPDLQRSRLLT